MKKVYDNKNIGSKLYSLSLNAILAEEISLLDKSTFVEMNYDILHCSYLNNEDFVAYPYYKHIVIPDED